MFCIIVWPQSDAPWSRKPGSNDPDFVRHQHPPFWMKEETAKESHPGSHGGRKGEEGHEVKVGKWGYGQTTEVGRMGGPEIHNYQLEQGHVQQTSDMKAHWILLDKAFPEQYNGWQGEGVLVTDNCTVTLTPLGDTKTQTATGSAFADYV